jgi:hypothetical protein
MDTVTDSETFYNSVLDLFEDVEERKEVNDLQIWWNRCVYNLSQMCGAYRLILLAVKYSPITHRRNDPSAKTALWPGSRRNDQC